MYSVLRDRLCTYYQEEANGGGCIYFHDVQAGGGARVGTHRECSQNFNAICNGSYTPAKTFDKKWNRRESEGMGGRTAVRPAKTCFSETQIFEVLFPSDAAFVLST